MSTLVLFNKPFGVLSQFSKDDKHPTLKDYLDIPKVYPAGRLDRDSEGLLVLTDDGKIQDRIASPKMKMAKTYIVQVDGDITQEAVEKLKRGVVLKDGKTKRARAQKISEPDWLWERNPPVRFRKNIPTSWIELTIKEGKNRPNFIKTIYFSQSIRYCFFCRKI